MRSYWNDVGKLALRRKVPRDVPAICGMEAKVCRTLTRIEHDCLPLEFVAHKVERCDKVGIARHDDKCVGGVCVGIAEKCGGKIDIGPLLLDFYHMDKSVCGRGAFLAAGIDGWNPCLVLVVVTFDDIYSAMSLEGLEVNVLPFNRCGVMRICLGSGSEIRDGNKFMVCVKVGMDEHGVDKRGEVEPFAAGETAQQSVVEIAPVDVDYCSHLLSIKKEGSQTLRSKTLFRVGRTLRLDLNLLRGSVGIVPNYFSGRNGAERKSARS